MRSLLIAAAVCAALVLVPAAASAQTPPDCQTPNGVRSLSRIAGELLAVGYGGPWDPGAVVAAYARTTGGAVSCGGSGAPPMPSGRHDLVLFVGGLDSTPSGNDLTFGLLTDELVTNWGYRPDDIRQWFYGGKGPYGAAATCQPTATSENQLVGTLRALRDSNAADHVVLVGHSLGGLIAFEALAQAEDLVAVGNPFVSRVVTIDSPLGGLSWEEGFFGALGIGDCIAFAELRALHGAAGRQKWLTGIASWEMSRGVDVVIVSNPEDTALWLSEQQINANVNHVIDVANSGLNHSAVLKTAYGVTQLAPLIGAQGS